ncbi:LOW QUALITY PROTEIN: hypothetical protein ACHAWF_005178 [Thalassiosira exigua]
MRPEMMDFNMLINCCSFARRIGVDKSSQDNETLLQMQLEHKDIFDVSEGVLQTFQSLPYPDSAILHNLCGHQMGVREHDPEHRQPRHRIIELFRLTYRATPSDGPGAKVPSMTTEQMQARPGQDALTPICCGS